VWALLNKVILLDTERLPQYDLALPKGSLPPVLSGSWKSRRQFISGGNVPPEPVRGAGEVIEDVELQVARGN
jgi:hypothetical protein